jgi:hypothetical protein
MANEVYGEAGKNTFTIPNVVGFFSTTVNKETGVAQLFKQGPFLTQESIGTYNPSTGGFTPQANSSISQSDITKISSQQGINAIKGSAIQTAKKDGATNADQLISKNTAPNSENPDGQSAANAIREELGKGDGFKENTRKNYEDAKYPLNLKLENQDCIKFSIVEYKAPGIKPGSSEAGSRIVTLSNTNPGFGKDRKILATITLPIPGGINDRNPANWSDDSLDDITRAFSNIAMQSILGGGSAGVSASDQEISSATAGGGKNLESLLAGRITEAATGASNIISRQFGAVVNPNLELLFNGPSLRSFTFNFRFTPRETKEAQAVRKIIRQFKQAMSVKRSASSLLLKAPHTFAISYLSNNKDHPYLNRFKECALTDCSVSYTPDGTYMTYTDSSMTAYELSLTFQELEPIFDDDYFEIDENKDTSIGF